MRHRVAPYGDDPVSADAIERHAAASCRTKPLRPFVTDGCSFWPDGWPDGSWAECCVTHDIAYWCGGSRKARRAADNALHDCVVARFDDWRGPVLGTFMEAGVWIAGVPWLPTYWRWGYGHAYPHSYEPAP